MSEVPLSAEALIAAGLCGGDGIDLTTQTYQVFNSKVGMYPSEVVAPDGKLVLSTSSQEYAKDFAYAMNRCRWYRLNPDDGK